MAARTQHEAVADFRAALCAAFSCITNVVPRVKPYSHPEELLVATLRGDVPVMLRTLGGEELGMVVTIQYRVAEGDGGWTVRTASYEYILTDEEGHELLVYHWHPEWRGQVAFAHLHLQHRLLNSRRGVFEDKHLPTGRVALEDVLEMLLTDLGVQPNRPDWRETLGRTRGEFERVRTWAGRQPPPQL